MSLTVLLITFPFYWLVISSVKSRRELFTVDLWPQVLTIENYTNLLQQSAFIRYFLNSVAVAVVVTIVTICVSVLGAFSLVFFRYPGRELCGRLILFTYMFPGVVIIIPISNTMSSLHLADNVLGVMIVELVLTVPFGVWMLRGFFMDIPRELEEAAIVDGASKMRALIGILLPSASPGIIAVAVFTFIFSWNEYLYPLVLVNSEASKTLPLGIAGFMGQLTVQWGPLLASGVVSTVPILILFVFLQRFLIEGLTAGAVKG
jgi:multiple sugar transport system permease protein